MNKKNIIVILIETIVVIGIGMFYFFHTYYPEFKSQFGSSDHFIKTDNYQNMIEFIVDDKTNFSIIISKDKTISNILFFDDNSKVLYNQNIEGMILDNGVLEIVKLLIENELLKSNSSIKIIRYNDNSYIDFKNYLVKYLNKYKINNSILEDKSSLKDKCNELDISIGNGEDSDLLKSLDYYSKSISGSPYSK